VTTVNVIREWYGRAALTIIDAKLQIFNAKKSNP